MRACKGCVHYPSSFDLEDGGSLKCRGGYALVPSKSGKEFFRPSECVKKRLPKKVKVKKISKPKKPSRKRLVKRMDELWSLVVRARDGRCVRCGKTADLQAHHFIVGRRCFATRWLPENGVTLCQGCHFLIHHLHGTVRANRAALEFLNICITSQGDESGRIASVLKAGEHPVKYSLSELETIKNDLSAMLARLVEGRL